MVAGRFTDGRVPDSTIRSLFEVQHRWQRWLGVEAALAAAEAERAELLATELGSLPRPISDPG
ncbi:MAG: hypothetical protein QOE71_3458 [Pseudonocardiales bacterium]|nr:hypothetical protein [Pseudonocardiales bacterium]MDQ1752402.1 hypothetical protein [Pseudonocardiales bacterium]